MSMCVPVGLQHHVNCVYMLFKVVCKYEECSEVIELYILSSYPKLHMKI